MKRFIISALLILTVSILATGQTTSFYTDRAVGTFPVGSGTAKVTALIPIQYGPVRVCSLPLTQAQPCLPLASITDINNNPISNAIGGAFGQLTTDVVGRFTFGCQVNLNYQIQVAPASSNVPQLNYPITCPGTGANPSFSILTVGTETVTNTLIVTGAGGLQGPGFHQQIFTSSGTFTIPAGITQVKVTVVAGGGAGGGADGVAAHAGGGGGSAGATIGYLSGLTPGNTLTITVGVGGTGVSNANGNVGGGSSVTSGTQTISSITATGGGGGASFANGGTLGTGGGQGVGGNLNFGGNPGGNFLTGTNLSGIGGGSIFGGGANPAIGSVGTVGFAPGAGGSGAGGNAGGNVAGGPGANGIVIFEWVN